MDEFPAHLTTEGVLKYLGGAISRRHLENMRLRGDGPAFVKISKRTIVYPRDALDRWLAEREFTTTAEARGESALLAMPSTADR